MIALLQHLRSTNDRNGNPRRLFLVTALDPISGCSMSAAVDEGYMGRRAADPLTARLGFPTHLPTLDIPPSEYRDTLRVLGSDSTLAEFAMFIHEALGPDDDDDDDTDPENVR